GAGRAAAAAAGEARRRELGLDQLPPAEPAEAPVTAEAAQRAAEQAAAAPAEVAAVATPAATRPATEEEEEAAARPKRPGVRPTLVRPNSAVRRGEPRRRTGKLTIPQAHDESGGERMRSLASVRRAREKEKQRAQELRSEGQKVVRDVIVPETIMVQELANRMAVRGADVIKALMKMGIMATINQALDADTAELVAGEFGHRVRRVSAADDEIMQQTIEAIHHARAARVPVIVAINKMDRPDANPGRVRQELLQHELVVEEMGGDVLAVEVSAKTKAGLDRLEEAISLQAEVLELGANPDRPATGAVIEARLERGRGAVATLLVQRGTIRVG